MLNESIKKFITWAPELMPDIIGDELPEVEVYDDSAVLDYTLGKEHDIEEILNAIEDDMDLLILYHVIRERAVECRQHACAVSDPNGGHMYKLNIASNRNDKVDRITVTVYSDIVTMISETREDKSLHERGGFAPLTMMDERVYSNLFAIRDV